MATTQTFETVVTLNAQQAKNELTALQKTVEDLKKKKAEALRDNGSTVKDINRINKEIKSAEANVKAYRSNVSDTIETLNNFGSASVGDIERVARALKREMKSVTSTEETLVVVFPGYAWLDGWFCCSFCQALSHQYPSINAHSS